MSSNPGIEKYSLIVSCQATEEEPLRDSYVIGMMAYAVVSAGVRYIRANWPEDIAEIKKRTNAFVIGIYKDSELAKAGDAFITVRKSHIDELIRAGADAIAIDCTRRKRPEPLDELFKHIRDKYPKVEIIADVADIEDVKNVLKLKPDYIATTLSGYTDYSSNRTLPDLELIKHIKLTTEVPVIAEGGYSTFKQVREALLLGAHAVVVGSAITRPHLIAKKFLDSIADLKPSSKALGFDIGGTNIRLVVIDTQSNVLYKEKLLNPQKPSEIFKIISEKFFSLSEKFSIDHIGVASAGRIDTKSGLVTFASKNINNWTGVNLKEEICRRTKIEPVVDNDANALAFAHQIILKESDFVLITVGTGVGAGAVINNQLIRGKFGGAMEVGHIIFPGNTKECTCGKTGCLETLLKGDEIRRAYESENIKSIAKTFAWLIDSLKMILDFQKVYIHGVITSYGMDLLQNIIDEYKKISPLNEEQIKFSTLDEYSGALGAALESLYCTGGDNIEQCYCQN